MKYVLATLALAAAATLAAAAAPNHMAGHMKPAKKPAMKMLSKAKVMKPAGMATHRP